MEKKNRRIEIISFIVLIVLIIALGLTIYLRRNSITNVNRVLADKYDEIKCITDKCKFVSAYKKSKNKIYIYDSYGSKIGKIDVSENKELYDASHSYLLFKKYTKKGKVKEYIVAKLSGKKVYSSNNELVVLSDYLVEEKGEDSSNIINYKGKVIYSDVKKVGRYENVSSIRIMDEEYLIDERGNRILEDYSIDKAIKNDKDKVLYLILKDSSGAFYYFDIKATKISSDSFTSYTEGAKDYGLYIYKKFNGETYKYILNKKGEQKEDENDSQVKLVEKIKEMLDEKYNLYTQSVVSNKQSKVLVDNLEDNSFGTFDINEKKYKKVYDYTKENGSSIIFNFDTYDDNKYFQIICTENNCGKSRVTVYDVNDGKVLYKYEDGDNKIKYFTGIKGGYILVKFSNDSTEEYRDKYVLFDKKLNEIVSSKNLITVVDKKILFGKKYDEEPTIIYSTKLKKVLNNDDSLADIKKINKTKLYVYSDDVKTYFVSTKGNVLYKINNATSNVIYTDEVVLNVTSDKVKILDAKSNKLGEYTLKEKESVYGESNTKLPSYKNSIFVNNTSDNYGKIVDYSGKKIKKLKNTIIKEVDYCKKTNSIIIITVNNGKYGLFVAK